MKKQNKYTYYKVIQEFSGNQWNDVDYHETNSQFLSKDRKLFKENLKAYRENSRFPIRVIKKKEKNEN